MSLSLLAALPAVYVVYRRYRWHKAGNLSVENELIWNALYHSRFTRPVLRPPARPCNAAKRQDALYLYPLQLGGLSAEEVNERLGYLDTPLPSDLKPLLSMNATMLNRLQASAQCSWSWSADKIGRRFSLEGGVLTALIGRKLMLARARTPAECLDLAAHSYRIAQDRAAGAGMSGAMTLNPAARLLAKTAVRCGVDASSTERKLAQEAFYKLRQHRLHAGTAFLDEVSAAHNMLSMESLRGKSLLFPSNASEMDSWRLADDTWELAAALAATIPQWRSLDRIDSRSSLKRVCDWDAAMAENPVAAAEGISFGWCEYAKVMMETTILLRMATLALFAVEAGVWPSEGLTSDLLDPYSDSGDPLISREDGKTRWVWSVGENGKDDRAASESDDIVLRFNLASPQ